MAKKLVIIIAVEKYADSRIPTVKYAEDDAKGSLAALELGGALDNVALLSARATKTTINSQVRQHVKALTATDQLYVFYAGHGFSKNGHNFITCHDTDPDDLEDTSINLKELLDICGKSACKRIAVFLDSCESGITDLPEIRGIYATMSARARDCDPGHTRTVVWSATKLQRANFQGRFSMAMFWLSTALGALGFAAIMFAIPPDDAQLLGKFPESNPRYRDPTDSKRRCGDSDRVHSFEIMSISLSQKNLPKYRHQINVGQRYLKRTDSIRHGQPASLGRDRAFLPAPACFWVLRRCLFGEMPGCSKKWR